MIVPIVFCADGNYGRYLPVAVQSIVENSSASHEYHIIIFDCGIKPEDLAVLERQIARYPHFRLRVENIANYLELHKKAFYVEKHNRLSPAAYGRLLIPELCDSYDRVIYSDIDIVFERDVAELIEIDLDGAYIGAVADIGVTRGLKTIIPLGKYINSGLLIFPIPVWKHNSLTKKCIALLAKKRLKQHDQDAINIICANNIHYIDNKWNCINMNTATNNNAVFHYCGIKPWQSLFMPKADIWWRYAAKTETHERLLAEALCFNNQAELMRMNAPVTYYLLGVPLFSVRVWPYRKKYYLGKMRHRHIAKTHFDARTGYFAFYLFEIKLFSRRP